VYNISSSVDHPVLFISPEEHRFIISGKNSFGTKDKANLSGKEFK
jgi:hypothetical protein